MCIRDSLSLDTDKILPTPEDFARINNLVFIENANGPVVYDNGFYYTQDGITAGVQPITWTASKALGESIVGATMYVVNSPEEESLVYSGLQHMGLTGDDGIAFWLGLYQDLDADDFSEPDGGWCIGLMELLWIIRTGLVTNQIIMVEKSIMDNLSFQII